VENQNVLGGWVKVKAILCIAYSNKKLGNVFNFLCLRVITHYALSAVVKCFYVFIVLQSVEFMSKNRKNSLLNSKQLAKLENMKTLNYTKTPLCHHSEILHVHINAKYPFSLEELCSNNFLILSLWRLSSSVISENSDIQNLLWGDYPKYSK
jgi:hypothetical protein